MSPRQPGLGQRRRGDAATHELNNEGTTVVMVTHSHSHLSMRIALSICSTAPSSPKTSGKFSSPLLTMSVTTLSPLRAISPTRNFIALSTSLAGGGTGLRHPDRAVPARRTLLRPVDSREFAPLSVEMTAHAPGRSQEQTARTPIPSRPDEGTVARSHSNDRISPQWKTMAVGDRQFSETVLVVDPNFSTSSGSPRDGDPAQVFSEPESIVRRNGWRKNILAKPAHSGKSSQSVPQPWRTDSGVTFPHRDGRTARFT